MGISALLKAITFVTGPLTLGAFALFVVVLIYYRSVKDRRGLDFAYKLLRDKLTRNQFYDICVKLMNRLWWGLMIVMGLAFIAWCIPQFRRNAPIVPAAASATSADDAPTSPGEYPSIDEIIDLPDKERVERPPVVSAENVNFRYRNVTNIPMKLVLFDCYYLYFPLLDDPLAPQGAWRAWDCPATGKFLTFSEFKRGTGVVFRGKWHRGQGR